MFDRSNLERSSKVFTFSMERNIARVCLPSVWASHSTQGFHQTYETYSSHVETEGSAPNYIFRRHVNHGRVTSLALHHAASALNLLESACFVVNYHKSQLIPSQQIEFLGFLVDSVTLSLQLPGEKLQKILKQCQQLLNVGETSIRELSKFLGLLTSSIQAVFPAPLHYRHLQRLKNLSRCL